MSNDGLVELKADAVTYYSARDEYAFFDWLGKMVCVKNHYGKGTELYIVVDRAAVSQGELLDLIAFFYRYNMSMAQLREFDVPEFSDWFRRNDAYWNSRVFGGVDAP